MSNKTFTLEELMSWPDKRMLTDQSFEKNISNRNIKLKDVNFNSITEYFDGIVIFVDDKERASGYIGEVLHKCEFCAGYKIISINQFFNQLVFRLTSKGE